MGYRRRLLLILRALARVSDRRFVLRLQSGRATVRHPQGGGERVRGQGTRRLSGLRKAPPATFHSRFDPGRAWESRVELSQLGHGGNISAAQTGGLPY